MARGTQRRGRHGLSPTQRKYARARANGSTMRDAAREAGLESKRGLQGVTGAEWEKLREVQDAIRKYAENNMGADEVKGRLAAMARGEIPTAVVTDGQGLIIRKQFKQREALEAIAKILGLMKEHEHGGLDGIAAAMASKDLMVIGVDSARGKP